MQEKLAEKIDHCIKHYNEPPYGREIEGTVELLQECKNAICNNGWIPCSERLPEDGEDVLVWFEYFRYGSFNRLYQTIGISYMYNGKWSGFVNGHSGWQQSNIIAWQPLPEPYEPKGEDAK